MFAGAVAWGCGQPPAPSAPAPTAVAEQSDPSTSPEQLEAWIEFRRVYGLNTDIEWVLDVARAAVASELDVPLLPFEIDRVASINQTAQKLVSAVERYGWSFPEEFGGVFLDGPVVVINFTRRVAEHTAAVKTLFAQGPSVEVREARYTIRELNGFADMVRSESAWFESIGAEFVTASIGLTANRVQVRYRANTLIEGQVRAHFGNPDWLALRHAGALDWTGPRGDLELRVVDKSGQPVAVECVVRTLDERVRVREGLPSVEPDGVCARDGFPAVEWLVDVTFGPEGMEKKVTATLQVPPGGVARKVLVVDA